MEQDGFPVAQSAVSNMERNVKALIPTREKSTTEPYPLFINGLPRNWTSHPVRWLYTIRTRSPSNQQFTNGGKTYSHYIENWPTKQKSRMNAHKGDTRNHSTKNGSETASGVYG